MTSNIQSNVKALPYDLPYMTEEMRKRAKIELFEDEDTRIRSLKLLRTLLEEEENLHYMDEDHFLLAFLRTRKFDIKRTLTLVKQFYRVKKKHEELYGDMTLDIIRNTLEDGSVGFLPYRDDDGSCVLILHLGFWDPNRNSHGDLMRVLTGGLLHACRSPSTQVAGIKVIVDVKNFTVAKLTHISPTYLWLFTEALQNCFPARFKGVHIVNESSLFNPIWKIMRQFLTKKLSDRFHFHGKNMTKLHKHFNPKILPKDYGGEMPPYSNADWAEKFIKDFDYFYRVSTFGYIKSSKK